MKLRYITASDPREHVSTADLMNLLHENARTEIAVQAHPSKMSWEMPRHKWFDNIVHIARNSGNTVNLAVHVNMDWANMFCRGNIAPELLDWFFAVRDDTTPVIRRWQININGSKTPLFQTDNIAKILLNYPDREFIFQYSAAQYHRMQRLNKTCANFSVLYDLSGGTGAPPRGVRAPIFDNHPMGYSGGISPENVASRLNNIARVAPTRTDIWIDAEGKLKNPATGKFDIQRAREYINAAIQWQQTHIK